MTSTPQSGRRARRTLSRRLEQAGLGFETGILEMRVAMDPGNVALLSALAEACTRLRRYADGLALDRRLVEHDPTEPVFRYNLACSLVLTGDLEAACASLEDAVRLGYRDFEHMAQDADLRRLRKAPGYPDLLQRLTEIARVADA
ncbi:MAG: TPR end-of-group domain-containing protein [Planctomycetota bacterium]|jgi:predicted Zn-dependent protease